MKTLFLEARFKGRIKLDKKTISKLPNSLALATTVQFIDSIKYIKDQLETSKKKVTLLKGRHSEYKGQILGCDILEHQQKINSNSILYIGTGRFHPLSLIYKYNLPIYHYDPFTKKLIQIKDTGNLKKRKDASLLKFLSSDLIGIITTTKPGQSIEKKIVDQLKRKYKNKQFYDFISDTIDFTQMNNFNFIECWINTACPRIAYDDHDKLDKSILNIYDLEELK